MRATIARMDDVRYPVGKFTREATVSADKRRVWIQQIKDAPAAMRQAISGLSERQLDTPYRPGGWTVRQVAHHVPDSHMNAYIRCKLALTEDNPTIKAYNETEWAKVADTARTPVNVSLTLLESLHTRWGVLLDSLAEADFARPLQHPEHGQVTIDWLLQLYAWHGRHHVAHIMELRKREGWT